ncbi:DUF58 domain-containing protein [Evansella cellulosilytica]|uniref:Uncharacterized protein n=1 Tax=Evansella cellulosilytica (strain ATCC 21833 / DSM 2522 / FERM P-1141 / JCM 9156 / N-4) TaxID=649639 RepID=E6U028_EVAC2|nr:DUF58 domain-containing protein [Evansella cellulosilytica]ADU29032.1 protein of unknown function DUF58 [Evansella cellulosilytica DSM 2522]
MTRWKKEITFTRKYYAFGYMIPAMAILSFVTGELILFSLTILSLAVFLINNLYLKYVSKHIFISEGALTKRLFPEERTTLTVPFENKGKIPFFLVKASFYLYYPDESVKVVSSEDISNYYSNYESPFSIAPLTKRKVGIHLEALKRGIAQLNDIQVDIYDLFKFTHIRLKYQGFYRAEALVYPSPIAISGLEKIVKQEKGDHPQPSAVNEDVLMTMGNRDYVSTDPFNRINWKASARTNELQTKIFEKVTISQWTIVVNIRGENSMVPTISNLEEVLSQVTYACQFATKQQISFEMYINIRVPRSSVGMHLPLSSGKTHLVKALEILARIRRSNLTIPIEYTLDGIMKSTDTKPFILHFGALNAEEAIHYKQMRGGTIHVVNSNGGSAHLESVGGVEHDEKLAK